MSHVSKAVTVGGWEGLIVAVVIVARRDALRGDTKAAEWVATVAPYVLGLAFPDIEPVVFADRLRLATVAPMRRQRAA